MGKERTENVSKGIMTAVAAAKISQQEVWNIWGVLSIFILILTVHLVIF